MTQPAVTVTATFQARPGQESALRLALLGLLTPTRQEPGCLNYDLHQSAEDSARFLFHENWTDRAALDAHLQTPHVQQVLSGLPQWCAAAPQIQIWTRIG